MAAKKKPALIVGDEIDNLIALRTLKKSLEDQLNEIKTQIVAQEALVFRAMDAQKMTKGNGTRGHVGIFSSVRPALDDWDDFSEFVYTGKNLHLLERRLSVTGCRELFSAGIEIPGVSPYTARALRVRETT